MKSFDDYQALSNGADDTDAIQAALDGEYEIHIPPKPYRITRPVYQRKVMRIEGGGHIGKIIADFATPQLGAWIVDLAPGPVRTGGTLRGFAIEAPCPNIRFDLSSGPASYINRWKIENLKMNNTANGYALELFNPTNNDGFFCSTISDCVSFNGGLHLPRCGDSVEILRNTITGAGDGINIYSVAGANLNAIVGNNITSFGTAIHCGSYMRNTFVHRNNIEQVGGKSDYCILFDGVSSQYGANPTITKNTINGWGNVAGALIGMTTPRGVIDDNETTGCNTAIYLTGSTTGVRIGKRGSNSCPTLLVNQGVGNVLE